MAYVFPIHGMFERDYIVRRVVRRFLAALTLGQESAKLDQPEKRTVTSPKDQNATRENTRNAATQERQANAKERRSRLRAAMRKGFASAANRRVLAELAKR